MTCRSVIFRHAGSFLYGIGRLLDPVIREIEKIVKGKRSLDVAYSPRTVVIALTISSLSPKHDQANLIVDWMNADIKVLEMNEYQQEQLEALRIVRRGLFQLSDKKRTRLIESIREYDRFRLSVDQFLKQYFSNVCTDTCYLSRASACCTKDGIITFFADTVVNALHATPAQLDRLETVLNRVNRGIRCVYLGSQGCRWTIRPVVCAMFLCDRALQSVFNRDPEARKNWESLRRQEKLFKWPDRPVLFDDLEKIFLDLGYRSTLMHLNRSPGLLRVKKDAGLI